MLSTLLFLYVSNPIFAPPLLGSQPLTFNPPQDFLARDAVRLHLDSGLTVTLGIKLDARGGLPEDASTAFRIDVRYEPWDELYLVTVRQPLGGEANHRFESFSALHEWWQTPNLCIASAEKVRDWRRDHQPLIWQVVVEVIPFSHDEQRQVRRWLTSRPDGSGNRRSANTAQPGSSDQTRIVTENTSVMQLILATSIRRDAVYRDRWRFEVP